jgi:DNA-binding NarL/FixJ family response regulator
MKILLADDHALIRSGLRGELETLGGAIDFVEAWDATSLREMFRRHDDLELAIVDLTMPGMERDRTIAALRADFPLVPIVVLSGADAVTEAMAVLRAGAAGFIPKSGMSKVMLQAIRLVLAGGQYLPPEMIAAADIDRRSATVFPPVDDPRGATAASERPADPFATKPLASLSERQKQVFALLAEGLSNKAIARRLGITEGTVKTHVATIFDVLNVHNRVSAVAAARGATLAAGKPKGE